MSAFGGKADVPITEPMSAKADIQASDFDLDQIRGLRARTIVNDGLAFCETGARGGVSRRLLK